MKKKLLSVILAVAVAFTFSFAMVGTASAATTYSYVVSWGKNLDSVTVSTDEAGTATRTLPVALSFENTTGITTATPDTSGVAGIELGGDAAKAYRCYYDFTNATVGGDLTYATYPKATFDKIYTENDGKVALGTSTYPVTLTAPTDADIYANRTEVKNPEAADKKAKIGNGFTNYKVVFDFTESYNIKSTAEQSFTADFDITAQGPVDYTTSAPAYKGAASKAIKVEAGTAQAETPVLYVDKAVKANALKAEGTIEYYNVAYYDGNEHTIIVDKAEGWTIKYSVYNWKTGLYGDATTTAPTFKDVNIDWSLSSADENGCLKFAATATDSKGKETEIGVYEIVVLPVVTEFVFKSSSDSYNSRPLYTAYGEYNAKDYVKNAVGNYSGKFSTKDDCNFIGAEYSEAAESAIEANKEELSNGFDDGFVIDEEIVDKDVNEEDYSLIELNIEFNDELTDDEQEAYLEKYETLLNNIWVANLTNLINDNSVDGLGDWTSTGAYVALYPAKELDNEVEFTKAPLKKTYKANKKGKLAKTKNFTIKAEATAGTVTYKLTKGGSDIKINKETGKVTVKKGLKKGTYKVNVTAISDVEGYAYAYDEYTLAVKIK